MKSFGDDAETLKDRETNDNVTSKDAEIADDAHPADNAETVFFSFVITKAEGNTPAIIEACVSYVLLLFLIALWPTDFFVPTDWIAA